MNEELLMGLALFGGGGGGGGTGGTTNYDALSNRPKINGVTLTGDKSTGALGLPDEMQAFFDKAADQSSELAEDLKLCMKNTESNAEANLGTESGLELTDGTDRVEIAPDGTPAITTGALKKIFEFFENNCVVTKEVPLNGWSATATSINGTTYYTNTISLTEVFEEHPDVNIDTYAGDVLPSAAERSAFKLVASTGYFKADKTAKTITAYSQEKPASGFRIFIKGAK